MPSLLLTGRVGKLSGKMRVKKAVRKVQKFMGWGRYNIVRQVKQRRIRTARSLYQYEPTEAGKKRMERRQQEWQKRAVRKAIRQVAMKSALYGTVYTGAVQLYKSNAQKRQNQKAAAMRAKNKMRRL